MIANSVRKESPALVLYAAIVAKAGDVVATLWLHSAECLDILVRITTNGINLRCLQERLLL
jgi:hypothetical protein